MKIKKRRNKLNHIEKGVLTWVRIIFYMFVSLVIILIIGKSILSCSPYYVYGTDYEEYTPSDFWRNFAFCFILYMINPVYKYFRRIEMKKQKKESLS